MHEWLVHHQAYDRSTIFEFMVVAVHPGSWPHLPTRQYFILKLITALSSERPDDHLYVVADESWAEEFAADNISIIDLPHYGALFRRYRTAQFIRRQLKKINAQSFLSLNGYVAHSKLPQHVFVEDELYLQRPPAIKKRINQLKRAQSIFVSSEKEKTFLGNTDPSLLQKTTIVRGAAKELYHTLSFEEQAAVKEKYTYGTEYLLYSGLLHPEHIVRLLKAFSFFKKRQKTSMKMVLASNTRQHQKEITSLLNKYKYRADVVLQMGITELEASQLFGAAYGFIYPFNERTIIPALSAMQCGTPVVASAGSALAEITPDAALFYADNDNDDLADKIMLLYKDESLRARLIEKGTTLNQGFAWRQSTDLIAAQLTRVHGK